jgi:hypothetical protein
MVRNGSRRYLAALGSAFRAADCLMLKPCRRPAAPVIVAALKSASTNRRERGRSDSAILPAISPLGGMPLQR